MGWIAALLFAAALFVGLAVLARLPRRLFASCAAALVLGLAGYAWQGSPGLAGSPTGTGGGDDPGLFSEAIAETRNQMQLTRFGAARAWLVTADAFLRKGKYQEAAAYLGNGLKKSPRNPDLWVGQGVVLLLAADGRMTPAAEWAFARARELRPDHPAPDYFLGLARIREGRLGEASALWRRLLARADDDAEWKAPLEARVAALDRLRAAAAMEGGPPPPGASE